MSVKQNCKQEGHPNPCNCEGFSWHPDAPVSKIQAQVEEFHRAFDVPVGEFVRKPWEDFKLCMLRLDLIREETKELDVSMMADDPIAIADAIGDLLYVVYGTAVSFGINMEPIVDEIHRSNMSKLGADGKPIHREDGKVLKGPNFTPPDLRPILFPTIEGEK